MEKNFALVKNEWVVFTWSEDEKSAALLDKFLAVCRQYSHVSTALIDIDLFEISFNAIVNRVSVLSYETVRDSTQNHL